MIIILYLSDNNCSSSLLSFRKVQKRQGVGVCDGAGGIQLTGLTFNLVGREVYLWRGKQRHEGC